MVRSADRGEGNEALNTAPGGRLNETFEVLGWDWWGRLEDMLVDAPSSPLNPLDQVVAEHHVADAENNRSVTDRLQDMVDELVQLRLWCALL